MPHTVFSDSPGVLKESVDNLVCINDTQGIIAIVPLTRGEKTVKHEAVDMMGLY